MPSDGACGQGRPMCGSTRISPADPNGLVVASVRVESWPLGAVADCGEAARGAMLLAERVREELEGTAFHPPRTRRRQKEGIAQRGRSSEQARLIARLAAPCEASR